MCGIVGMLQWDGQTVEEAVLAEALASLSHRGPEGRGQVVLKNTPTCSVGLAHARLKIIDLSEEASQPMSNDDQSVWIVFNGEIYNFLELRASLQQRGVRFRTASDTEVLLRLYEAEGVRCVERLEGMFAFAVWDARRRQLLLGRDRVGKKPLFYSADPGSGRFAFASEIKALLRYPPIIPEVDAEALPAFFLFGYVPTPHTLYRGICQLPPGHLLTLSDEGRLRIEAYWDVPLAAPAVHRAPSEAEAVDRVRALLTAAVRKRLVADVPLGAFLSGGIDSSIIVGLMSRLQREPVRTFSIGFSGDSRFDETRYARLVARHFGTQHTEFRVEPSAVELIEQLVWHYDGPFADSSAIPTYLLAQLTKAYVTVALNGDGGDELFAGYLRFCATLWSERVPLALRRAARSLLTNLPPWGGPRSLWGRLQKFAGSAALPFNERFSRWVAVFYEDLPHLWTGTNGARAPLAALDPYVRRCRDASPLTQLLYLNLKTYLPDDLLVKADRCSMAHALEARSPFLDRELLEYVFSLPDAMKLHWGRTKVILRQAFTDMLPQPVLRRGKMGFGVPLQRWFRTDLKEFLQDVLLSSSACWRQYLDASYVGSLVRTHVSGRADHSHRLWTLLTFEVWLRNVSLKADGHPAGLPAAGKKLLVRN
ncbi:MAG: asparagine synthase (glutamine-hydrolyzing) [Candidatus Omnitrophica bacterium]|nr:asparagine synthase (glutamine-hydrolyzing) [Candidatus Omnitrophota bacterium]MBI3021844.1 asparagine synthase (glutamine-hydrolyzing) [Candidatus Omnitrophota bacterium]